MGKILMTIDWPHAGKPSIRQVANYLEVAEMSIDKDYGIILIDPEKNAYAFQLEEQALKKNNPDKPGVEGPFSNPRIEPFDIDPDIR